MATVTLPAKAGSVLPKLSWALTWTAGLMTTPTAVLPLGWTVKASWVAEPGVAVAVKVTGLPASPGAVAVSVFGPATVPSIQLPGPASPLPVVVTGLGPVRLPPPEATANVTLTPATGLPN